MAKKLKRKIVFAVTYGFFERLFSSKTGYLIQKEFINYTKEDGLFNKFNNVDLGDTQWMNELKQYFLGRNEYKDLNVQIPKELLAVLLMKILVIIRVFNKINLQSQE